MKEMAGDDPFERVAVVRPDAATEESDRQTARCLVEEFALGGLSSFEIGELFTSPEFGLPHAIYRRRGADFVRELIVGVFGGRT